MNSRKVWVGFGVLCLLAGSRWLVEATYPSPLPPGPRNALHAGLVAVVLGAIAVVRRERWVGWGKIGGLGVLVFALPGAVMAAASGRVAGLTEELVFLLLPVVTVLVMAQETGFGQEEDVRRLLGPALTGLAGALLMVPFRLPASNAGKVWLAALVLSIVLAGWGTVRLHGAMQARSVLPMCATIAAFSAALAAFSLGGSQITDMDGLAWRGEVGEALLIDGPLLVLGVWCVRELTPIRFSARVLLILLVAILESFTVDCFTAARPTLTWTIAAGAALMAVGGGWLLRKGEME